MSDWVLLLGGSTGHGAATAKRLAEDGYGIIAVSYTHLTLPTILLV